MIDKSFKTLEEQIKILKSRNMQINETDKELLLKFNYYHIVNNYSLPFFSGDGENYKDGTSIQSLIDFWKFERKLMTWVMPYILEFEHVFKSIIFYLLAEKDHIAHYGDEVYKNQEVENIKKKLELQKRIIQQEIQYLSKNISDHLINGKTPIWILINKLTFNEVILLFERLNDELKEKILKRMEYNGKQERFAKHCRIIKEFRNKQSHNGVIHLGIKLRHSNKWKHLDACVYALSQVAMK